MIDEATTSTQLGVHCTHHEPNSSTNEHFNRTIKHPNLPANSFGSSTIPSPCLDAVKEKYKIFVNYLHGVLNVVEK